VRRCRRRALRSPGSPRPCAARDDGAVPRVTAKTALENSADFAKPRVRAHRSLSIRTLNLSVSAAGAPARAGQPARIQPLPHRKAP
jgi:hypothetical protein